MSFPATPSINDTHTVGAVTWTWNGTGWARSGQAQTQQLLAISSPITVVDDLVVFPPPNLAWGGITYV